MEMDHKYAQNILEYFYGHLLQGKMLLITSGEYLGILYGTTYSWWLPGALEHLLISSGFCHGEISGSSQGLLGNFWPTWKLFFCSLCSYLGESTRPVEVLLLFQLIQFSALLNFVVPTQTASLAMFVFWWGKQGSTWGRGNVPKWEWVPSVEEEPGCGVNSKLISCPSGWSEIFQAWFFISICWWYWTGSLIFNWNAGSS